jgi:phosphoglycerate kinase
MFKTIKELDIKNKRVLVRCDFNTPLNEKGDILDDFKIKEVVPTIKYLIKNKAKVILISHLGEPEKAQKFSLKPAALKLGELLSKEVKFLDDCIGKDIERQTLKMEAGEILLLENLRFHKEEKENERNFAKELSKLADIYINDSFGSSHRAHASIVGIPEYLPSGAGLLLEKEVRILSKVLETPWLPLVAIIGGAKISTKSKFIKQLLEKADHLLIGGKIANTILVVKGICIGRPWPSEEVIKEVRKFDLTSTKFHLPIDVIVSPNETGKVYVRESASGKVRKDELILDIGPETIRIFSRIIEDAKMIIWSGPLGFFENPLFEKGTKDIAEKIVKNHQAFKIAGGGDTVFALAKFGLRDKFDHISTGGGAMLSFLSGEKLPGIEALEK